MASRPCIDKQRLNTVLHGMALFRVERNEMRIGHRRRDGITKIHCKHAFRVVRNGTGLFGRLDRRQRRFVVQGYGQFRFRWQLWYEHHGEIQLTSTTEWAGQIID